MIRCMMGFVEGRDQGCLSSCCVAPGLIDRKAKRAEFKIGAEKP